MKTSDFDYDLPQQLIAQTPLKDRSSSRLLVVNRASSSYQDKTFTDIIDYLQPGDGLVINETKVLPARIKGYKPETGGQVELLLLKNLGNDCWECLARPQKRLKIGTKIAFLAHYPIAYQCKKTHQNPSKIDKNSTLDVTEAQIKAKASKEPSEPTLMLATVLDVLEDGITHIKFEYSGIFNEILDQIGTMPLPPYIHKTLKDHERYQTVYAKNPGSAAAPTAGLHFTPELLKKIEEKGIKIIKITLSVGLGTFRPVQTDDITEHKMHSEAYEVTPEAAQAINEIKSNGGRIFAVGTTSVRTLESVANKHGKIVPEQGNTDIFIYPGYNFKIVDALITNFHLPKSTLLMLVSAFSSRDLIMEAYHHAIKEKYRFFSFGDAMLII